MTPVPPVKEPRNTAEEAGAPAVELRRIDKRFGAIHANRDVSLAVAPGTIHGIVGENGAGKSTLMSVLYGFYQADRGEIRVAGRTLAIEGSEDAIAAGIGMVHQHFMLVDTFTVVENVILGAEGGALLASGMDHARRELERLAYEYALEVPPDALVGDLPVGLQQRVEILKALYRGAEVLILDEPTGTLTPQEADHLFRILRRLKAQGKTVILITHKLREIMAVTDRVSIMRQGRMLAHRDTAATTISELAELMVGRRVLLKVEKGPAQPGRELLAVERLRVRDDRACRECATFRSRCGRARSSASPGWRATARASCWRRLPGSGRLPGGGSFSRVCRWAPVALSCAAVALLTCPRTAGAWVL